jgi:peptide/nickel transport system permease protein
MRKTIALRVTVGVVTLWAIATLTFLGMEMLPGDAARAALGRDATAQAVTQLRDEFGLDRPLTQRYGDWLGGVVRGDLGRSIPSGEPVTTIIGDKARNTGVLIVGVIGILIPLSLLLGITAAVRRDGVIDHTVSSSTLGLIATPEFVVGTMLAVLFAVWLKWLPPLSLLDGTRPVSGQLDLLVLPVLTLLAAVVAQTTRMIRACMIDVLQLDYVEAARLKGVPERRVLLRHALPNALGPTIQVFAINIAWLAGGVVVTETVFQFPGIGSALTQAVAGRDLPTVEALVVLAAAVYVLVNLAADLLVTAMNPRLRRSA